MRDHDASTAPSQKNKPASAAALCRAAVVTGLLVSHAALAAQPTPPAARECASLPAAPTQSTPAGYWRGMSEELLRRVFACKRVSVQWQDSAERRQHMGYAKMSAGSSPSLGIIIAGNGAQARVVQITETMYYSPNEAPMADALEKDLQRRFGALQPVPAGNRSADHRQGIQATVLPEAAAGGIEECMVASYDMPRKPACSSTIHYDIAVSSSTGKATGYVLFIDDFVDTAAVVAQSKAAPVMPALAPGIASNVQSSRPTRANSGTAQLTAEFLEAAQREATLPAAELKPLLPQYNQSKLDNDARGLRARLAAGTRNAQQSGRAQVRRNLREIRGQLNGQKARLLEARAKMATVAKDLANAKGTFLESGLLIRREAIVAASQAVGIYEEAWTAAASADPKAVAEVDELDRITRHNTEAVIAFNKRGRDPGGKSFDEWKTCLHSRLRNTFHYEDEVRCQKLDPMGRIPVPPDLR